MAVKKPAYASSVFVNCPFDEDYKPIRDAIIFAVFDCGFVPRCALEVDDGAYVRFEKIQRLISDSKFGIHDISMTDADATTGLPRFNMPLELGVFLGLTADKRCYFKCPIAGRAQAGSTGTNIDAPTGVLRFPAHP